MSAKNISRRRRPPIHMRTLYRATCAETGKRVYQTRRLARAARARVTGDPLSIYWCDACSGFHLGHLPRAVVAGRKQRP